MTGTLRFVDTPHGRLAYKVDGGGDGVPLVLLQRFRGSIDDWDPLFISSLAIRRRVIWFDSAGIGRSSGETPESIADMAEIAIDFLRAINVEEADLLGWSLGGFIGQHIALDAPKLVRRFIIAASGTGGVTDGPTQHLDVRPTMMKPVNSDEDFLFLFFTNTDAGRSAGDAYLKRMKAVADRGPSVAMDSIARQAKALATWPGLRSQLGEFRTPILIANGAHDVMIPAYRSYVLSQEAQNAKLVLYPDAGHGFLFQYIDQFTDEVNSFLS